MPPRQTGLSSNPNALITAVRDPGRWFVVM